MLRILTQNLWCHYLSWAPRKLQRIQAFCSYLTAHADEYDVLLIQELYVYKVWGKMVASDPKDYFLETMSNLGFKHYKDDDNAVDMLAGQNSGIMIISRYPVLQHELKVWRVLSDNVYGTAKGALRVKLDVDGSHVQLISLHLDSHMADMRKKQIQDIAEMIDTTIPTIVAGDFNIDSKAPAPSEFGQMLGVLDEKFGEKFFTPVFSDLTNQPRTFNRFFEWSLDHVLLSKEWEVVEKRVEVIKDETDSDISDHYGIYAVLKIEPAGTESE